MLKNDGKYLLMMVLGNPPPGIPTNEDQHSLFNSHNHASLIMEFGVFIQR